MRSDGTGSGSASREVLGRGSIYTLASAAPMLAGVLLLPITTRVLSQSSYGTVAVCLVLIQFGGIFAGSGMAIAITRHAILEESGVSGARGLVVASTGIASTVCILALATGRWWGPVALNQDWAIWFQVATVAAAASAIVANVQALLRAEGKAWKFVALASGGSLFGPLLGVALILGVTRTPTAYVSGLASAYVLAAAVGVVLVGRSGDVSISWREVTDALRVGMPTIPHQLALSISTGALVLIAAHRFGVEASARLQVALFIGVVPVVITSAVNNAWAPLVMRSPESERGRAINTSARDIGWIAASGSTVIAALSPWILQVVVPASYDRDSLIPVVASASVVAVLSVAYLGSSHLVFVSGHTTGLALWTPISVACGVGSAIFLVEPFGLVGAGFGFVITYAVLALTVGLLARRVASTRWSPSVLLFPALFAVGGSIAGGLLAVGGPGGLGRVALGLCAAAVGLVRLSRALQRR